MLSFFSFIDDKRDQAPGNFKCQVGLEFGLHLPRVFIDVSKSSGFKGMQLHRSGNRFRIDRLTSAAAGCEHKTQ